MTNFFFLAQLLMGSLEFFCD